MPRQPFKYIVTAEDPRKVADGSRQGYRTTIEKVLSLIPDAYKHIGRLAGDNWRDYRAYAVRWSAAYFGSIFGSAFLSALAGVLLTAAKEGAEQRRPGTEWGRLAPVLATSSFQFPSLDRI
jgi:hypothetical protein